jgi:hypothetical protein
MSIIFNEQILQSREITHDDIDKIFEFEKKSDRDLDPD